MSHAYTPTAVFPPSYVIPDDGDPKSASSVNIAFEALGDRTQYLYYRGGRAVLDYASIKAIAAPADGDRVYCLFGGDFIFKTIGAGPEDPPLRLNADDGTVGAWVSSAFLGVMGWPGGVPRLDGSSKLQPLNIPHYLANVDAFGPMASFTGTANTVVDVTGSSITLTVAIGDVLIIDASAVMSTPSAGSYVLTTNVSVNGGGSIGEAITANVGGQRMHKFKRVMAAAGTVVIKLQLSATDPAAVPAASAICLGVLQLRP